MEILDDMGMSKSSAKGTFNAIKKYYNIKPYHRKREESYF